MMGFLCHVKDGQDKYKESNKEPAALFSKGVNELSFAQFSPGMQHKPKVSSSALAS